MKFFIIPTTSANHLAKKIKRRSRKIEIIFPENNKEGKRYFPDGEVYIKIPKTEKIKNGKTIVLHSGAPKPNEGLVELELILQVLKDNKVKPDVFFTYFPYCQQDKIFERGETNAAESLIKKLINYYKVKKIYVIDPHFGGRKWVKKYPVKSVSAIPLLIEKAQKELGPKAEQARFGVSKNILFLSPDKGGKRRTGISGIKKKRINSFRVEMLSSKINFKGKTVGVVDDIIETGGTLLRFYKFLKKSGANKIIVLATQGILPTGISRVKKKYFKLYLTNAVNQNEANVDVSDLILENILKK